MAPAHSIPAQGQRLLLNGGGLPAAAAHFGHVEDTAGCHNKELVLSNQESKGSVHVIKAVLLAQDSQRTTGKRWYLVRGPL